MYVYATKLASLPLSKEIILKVPSPGKTKRVTWNILTVFFIYKFKLFKNVKYFTPLPPSSNIKKNVPDVILVALLINVFSLSVFETLRAPYFFLSIFA